MTDVTASKATLPHALQQLVAESADEPLVIDAITGSHVTRAQFDRTNRTWSRRLAALGLQPGETAATMMGPTLDAYSAWLGLAGLGAIEVPINAQSRGRSLIYLLNHSRAGVLIAHAAQLERVMQVANELESLRIVIVPDLKEATLASINLPFQVLGADEFASREADVEYRLAERHDTACIIYTSGTTGPPKGVIIPWGWMSTVNHLVPKHVGSGPRYSYLSPAHMSGKGALNNAVSERRTLVLRETFSVSQFWQDIARYRCSVSQLFPPQIRYLLAAAAPAATDRDTPLEHIWTAPLIPETRVFMERFGVSITTGFGSTEVGGPVAGIDVDATNLKSCGSVNPDPRGYEVRIVDEFDREVAAGEVGELIVRTAVPWTMNAGYFRNPEATAAAWRNGWFHTGDALSRDADGHFYFVDRLKDCIRRKGENISSFELEDCAVRYPGIAEAAAIGVPSADGEQEVKIFLLPQPAVSLDLEAVFTWFSEQLPRYMVPRYLEIVEDFPRTAATGRIQKSVLRTRPPGPREWDQAQR